MEHAHAVLSSKFVCVSNLIGEYKVNILNVVVAFQNKITKQSFITNLSLISCNQLAVKKFRLKKRNKIRKIERPN